MIINMCTPYDANLHLIKNDGHFVSRSKYAQIIKSLIYVMNCTPRDITQVISRLSHYTHNPNYDHWNVLSRVLRYLRGTIHYDLFYSGSPSVLENFINTI